MYLLFFSIIFSVSCVCKPEVSMFMHVFLIRRGQCRIVDLTQRFFLKGKCNYDRQQRSVPTSCLFYKVNIHLLFMCLPVFIISLHLI